MKYSSFHINNYLKKKVCININNIKSKLAV